jgi:DNA polymerase-3 subunit gamma/tau
VLSTIRSRTQHFAFNLIPADIMEEHVRWVIHDAGLEVGEEAIAHVIRVGGGSARDTLSALDQVAAAGGVVGGEEPVERLVGAVVGSNTGEALRAVSEAVALGRDPRVLGEALLASLRDVFLQRMGAPLGHLSDADRDRVAAWAELVTDRAVTKALEAVGAALLEMRQAPDTRIPLEVALVRITRSDADASTDGLLARIEKLEAALAARPTAPGPAAEAAAPPARSAAPAQAPAPAPGPPPASAPERPAGRQPAPPPPEAPAAPTGGAPTGAAAARAALRATKSAGGSPPPPPPARPAAPAAATSSSPPPPRPASRPRRDQSAAPAPAAAAPPAPSAAPAGRTTADGLPDRDALTLGWADHVLPTLSGLSKAMYAVGRFLSVEGGTAVYALPNEVHRQKCEGKRLEVEAALAKHFGRAVPLRLVVDDGGSGSGTDDPFDTEPPDGGGGSGPRARQGGGRAAAAPVDDESIDIHELVDAPADPRTHLDRLTEAFPGAQLQEEDR